MRARMRSTIPVAVAAAGLAIAAAGFAAGATGTDRQAADVPPPASGRTLTVGPDGDYATPQEAADAAQPGDNVEIAAGSYDGGLTIGNDGAKDEYITFYGKGGKAVLTGGDGGEGLLNIGGHSWLRFIDVTSSGSDGFGAMANGAHDLVFQNFEIDGSQEGGLVLLGTSNILVDGCDIHGTNAKGTDANHEAMSLAEGSSNIEVRGCTVHDNGEEGIDVKYDDDANAKIHDNESFDNRGPNIYVDSSSNVDVYNNVTHGTTEGSKAGIAIAVEDYSESKTVDDVAVYNNVSYDNAAAGMSFWMESSGTMSDIRVVNNTFAGNNGSISFDADFQGTNLLRNNIFADGDAGNDAFTSDHNLTEDPGFAGDGDFHVAPGSPAIDAGSTEGAPAFDADNKPRPAGATTDIGAYEQ